MLEQELTETTNEGKIRQLLAFFTTIPFEDITMDFNLKSDVTENANMFPDMMADALSYHFNVETTPEEIESLNTAQDLVDRINSNQ